MADAEGSGSTVSRRAINPEYRTSIEVTTRRGGIFWGLVLLIVGVVWLAGSLRLITLDFNVLLPLLVIVAGLYLLLSKLAR